MLESSFDNFLYLSPTSTRKPKGTRSPIGTGIALKCNPVSLGLNRHPTLYGKVSRDRNPSRSRSPSPSRGPTGTRIP